MLCTTVGFQILWLLGASHANVCIVDDFEVSIFLTEVTTRHSLLTKQKQFKDKSSRIRSNSGKLTNWLTSESNGDPIDVDDEEAIVVREESEDEGAENALGDFSKGGGRGKRRRENSDESLFIHDEISEDEGFQGEGSPSPRRAQPDPAGENDDKKKLGMTMSYDGFSI